MLLGLLEKHRLKVWKQAAQKSIYRFFTLLTRPFIDFYYNYGLSRASVMSYVLCANLIIFVYLLLALTLSVDAFTNRDQLKRFLELHFLWPSPEKLLIKQAPSSFPLSTRDIVTYEKYDQAIIEYCRKNHTTREELERENSVQAEKFSITDKLGGSVHEAFQTFQSKRFPLTMSFFVILATAYIVLLLNIKTNLAESVSPFIWGNVPLSNRSSEWMRILWRIPHLKTISKRLSLFFMLPFLVAIAVSLLYTCHKLVDRWAAPYSPLNNTFTIIVSLVITSLLFTGLYKLHVTEISKLYAGIGAFVASALWLGGRWLFTTYAAVSLYLNLHNFAFVPIILSWFYYFCAVFLFGIYVAHTLENPNLSNTARSWQMRDITLHNHYTTLASWVRLDFLYRLARNRNEEYRPPFIGINIKGDTADEIARHSDLPAPFVRESILEMIMRNSATFCIEVEGNRQYCKLRLPPEEINVIPLISDCDQARNILDQMENYEFCDFIYNQYGSFWQTPPIMLSDVYLSYKNFKKNMRPSLEHWKTKNGTEEIFL